MTKTHFFTNIQNIPKIEQFNNSGFNLDRDMKQMEE